MTTITEQAKRLVVSDDYTSRVLKAAGLRGVPSASLPDLPPDGKLREASAREQVRDVIEAHLLAGTTPPADVAQLIIDAQHHDQLLRIRQDIMNSTVRNLVSLVRNLEPEAYDNAFAYLADELSRVIDRTLNLAPRLTVAPNARAVLTANDPDVLDVWRELTALAAEYGEIRTVQQQLSREALKDVEVDGRPVFSAERWARVAVLADALDLDPYWREQRASAANAARDNNAEVQAYAEWLRSIGPATPRVFDVDLEPEERLILLAQTTHPWVPNVGQYQDAADAAAEAVRVPRAYDLAELERARAHYYAVTGAPAPEGVGQAPSGALPTRRPMNAQESYRASLSR